MTSVTTRRALGIYCVLALATLFVYWPALHCDFINFDDQAYLSQNPHVRGGLTWSGIAWAFRSGYMSNWHPLTWVSHMADCQVFGLKPAGHHLVNVAFHVADTLLLFFFLQQTTGSRWRSAFVAGLFALHPLHVESVAWVAERKDVLSTFFGLLALIAYSQYVMRHDRRKYWLALGLFALGLMCKPMLVTWPFVLLLLDLWPLRRFSQDRTGATVGTDHSRDSGLGFFAKRFMELSREKVPFFALTIVASIVTYVAQSAGGAVSSLESVPLAGRLLNVALSYLQYLSKTFWPSGLVIFYPYPHHLPILLAGAAALLLVLMSMLALGSMPKRPYLAVGWFWFLGTLVPTIGLVQVGSQAMADRYMYIPSIGLFILVVWGVCDAVGGNRMRTIALALAGTALLAACAALTRVQLRYWQNSAALFHHAIEVTGDNEVACAGLGKAYDDLGDNQKALSLYRESVSLAPHYPGGQYNLGTALMKEGSLDEAVTHLRIAVEDSPKFADAQNNLGNALLKLGRLDEATNHLWRAVTLNPDDPETLYNLGTALLKQSNLPAAVLQLRAALALNPEYEAAHANLGVALAREGNVAEAADHFRQAVRLAPDNASVHFSYGLSLMDLNQLPQAAEQFEAALRLQPQDAATHYRLALTRARMHQSKEAIAHCHEALRILPDFPEALSLLAQILASDPDPQIRSGAEAVRLASKACELTQNRDPDMIASLAAAYAEAGQFPEAAQAARRARDLARETGRQDSMSRAERLLKLFESGQPYHEKGD